MDTFIIVDILVFLTLGVFLYFGVLRRGIRFLICRKKITGKIVSYKEIVLNNAPGHRKSYYKPICEYIYDGMKYTEVVDYKIYKDKDFESTTLEFYINAKNPKLAIKSNSGEIVKMIIVAVFCCAFFIGYLQHIGLIKADLTEPGLRLLGVFFVVAYIYNVWHNIIVPIKDGVFSKGAFYIFHWVYMLVAMLTIGTIFLVLGVVFALGEDLTNEFMRFVEPYLKLIKFKL